MAPSHLRSSARTDTTSFCTGHPDAGDGRLPGYSCDSRARESQGLRPIPIIAFTGSSFDEDVRRALDSGADMHVSKPVRKEALADAIKGLIRFDSAGTRIAEASGRPITAVR